MKNQNLKLSTNLFAAATIALTGIGLPAFAQDTPAPGSTSTPAAESSVSPQDPLCRAANRSTPIFESASTISSALQLVAPDGTVRLTAVPPAGSQFAQINQPIAGFIQTAVLKTCSPTPPPPRSSCRVVVAPVAINVRSAPDIDTPNNIIGSVIPGQRLYVMLNANGTVISTQGDGYNWAQVDLTKTPFFRPSGTAWITNSRIGSGGSNLGYCQ